MQGGYQRDGVQRRFLSLTGRDLNWKGEVRGERKTEEKEVIGRIRPQRRWEGTWSYTKTAKWYLERKGCVSLERRKEEKPEGRCRSCWQVGRPGTCGAFSLMVSVLCRRGLLICWEWRLCGWYRGLIRDGWRIVLNGIQGSNEIGNIYVQGPQSRLMHVGAEKAEAIKVTVSSLLAYPLLHWASLLVGILGLYFFCLTIICQGHLTGRKYLQITCLMIV